jgi:MurNAc alpha-1-phosphate uridylyltransferase
MDRGQVSAELFTGIWADVGTPKRLQDLNSLSILTPKAHQT